MPATLSARVVSGVALFSGLAMVALALYLLVVGVDVQMAEMGGATVVTRETQWSAVLPLSVGSIYVIAILGDRLVIATTAAIAALVYGMLFVFSAGLYYAPLGLVMLLSVLWLRHHERLRSSDLHAPGSQMPG